MVYPKTHAIREYEEQHKSRDPLQGVVAFVQVCSEYRKLTLKAALEELGGTVVPALGPDVTHFVWSQKVCCNSESAIELHICSIQAPLQVDAFTGLSETSTSKNPDLPSATALCRMLKAVERKDRSLRFATEDSSRETWPSLSISSDLNDETSNHTSDGQNTREFKDQQNTPPHDKREKPHHIAGTNHRQEYLQKGLLRVDRTLGRQKKLMKHSHIQEKKRKPKKQLTKGSVSIPSLKINTLPAKAKRASQANVPMIVLTGMPKSQKQATLSAIKALKGKVQRNVDRYTTHVLLGLCEEDTGNNAEHAKENTQNTGHNKQADDKVQCDNRHVVSMCNQCNSPHTLLTTIENENVEVADHCSHVDMNCDNVKIICSSVNNANSRVGDSDSKHISDLCSGIVGDRQLRTVKTLLGAVRGCRVLRAQWALDSHKANKWLSHNGYEVTHLQSIAQTARVERMSLGKMHENYTYKVFHGMRISVSDTAENKDAAIKLLSECGAQIVNDTRSTQDFRRNTQAVQMRQGRVIQSGWEKKRITKRNAGMAVEDYDIIRIGSDPDEVSSSWVFDSVVFGRPRNSRRYVNKSLI